MNRQTAKKTGMISAVILLLVGCGGQNEQSDEVLLAIGDGLEPGQFELEITGAITTIGPFSGQLETRAFEPSTYNQTRLRNDGYGGREQVIATNAEGPYALVLRADLQRGDDAPDRETGAVRIQLPPEARAAETYVLRGETTARHGEGFVRLSGYGQPLITAGTGTVTVAEIGDHLSASFQFSRLEPDQPQHIAIRGRAFQVPLTRRGEAHYTLTLDSEVEERVDHARFRNPRSIMITQQMMIDFSTAAPEQGTYAIGRRPAAGVAGLQLLNHRLQEVTGELSLQRHGDTWSAEFQFEGRGEVPVSGEGRIEHLPVTQTPGRAAAR